MNRQRGGLASTISKASPTTTCQKCLQKDDYECRASLQSRPYASRPSRTQQLRNPKLKPTLSAQKLEPTQNEASAQESNPSQRQIEEKDAEEPVSRGRKSSTPTKSRSASSSSSTSIATISTQRSSSSRDANIRKRLSPERSSTRRNRSRSLSLGRKHHSPLRDRSLSPVRSSMEHSRRRRRSNSPVRKRRRKGSFHDNVEQSSPEVNSTYPEKNVGRRTTHESGDDTRVRQYASQAEPSVPYQNSNSRAIQRDRDRSLSPYSRRLALTQAMNAGR